MSSRRTLFEFAPFGDGDLIRVIGTTTGTSVPLFTALADTDGGIWDVVTIRAWNMGLEDVLLTLEIIAVGNVVTQVIPAQAGFWTVLERHPIRAGNSIDAFASTGSVIECQIIGERIFGGVDE